MALLLLVVMLTACAATPEDLSGKMFTFPQESNTTYVKLTISRQNISAATVCLRSFTDLYREHAHFSLATPSFSNGFLIYKAEKEAFHFSARGDGVVLLGQNYKLNMWHSICATWDSTSGLGQLWLDGNPSTRKFVASGSNIDGPAIIVLGQDQDIYGGGFDIKQSFVGMMSDVHMWDNVLSPCDIQNYVDEVTFPPGNVLNWKAMDFQIIGKVLLEHKQGHCHL